VKTVGVRLTYGPSSTVVTRTAKITIRDVAPTVKLSGGTVATGAPFTLTTDSPADVAADLPSLTYAFDCGGGTFGAASSATTAACTARPTAGTRNVRVRVTDHDGASSIASASLIVVARPQTTITTPAGGALLAAPAFAFTSNVGSAAFECRVDVAAFAPCSSPFQPTLTDGSHTLFVRAVDGPATDRTPAHRTITVDSTAPTVAATFPADGTVVVRGTHPTVQFACADAHPGTCRVQSNLVTATVGPASYTVRGTDKLGNQNDLVVHVTIAAGVPAPPIGVHASAGDRAATIHWTAPASTGGQPITGYVVTDEQSGAHRSVGAGATAAKMNGLDPLLPHTFAVRARNARGDGATSAPSDAVTPFATPGAPTAVTATPANGSVRVGWTASDAVQVDETTSYTVTASPGGAHTTVPDGGRVAVVGGLDDGVAYTFSVAATNADGTGPPSASTGAVTLDSPETVLLGQPPAVTPKPTATFRFDGSDPTTPQTGITFACVLDDTAMGPCTSPLKLTGLAAGDHVFQVAAVDAGGRVDPTPASYEWTIGSGAAVGG
jgi:titin